MRADSSIEFLKLLAHDVRWQILVILAESDRRVQELVELLERPMNLVSYHLRLLREAGLVQEHRSDADGRDLYYTLTLTLVAHQFRMVGKFLHPALVGTAMPRRSSARVLFLCTHNSARSQMAEALLRTHAYERQIEVFSAGSLPTQVMPEAIAAMQQMGIDIRTQQSKSLDLFREQSFDYVITLCDHARETCPQFVGSPRTIHWSIPDPSSRTIDDTERLSIFVATAQDILARVQYFVARLDAEDEQRF